MLDIVEISVRVNLSILLTVAVFGLLYILFIVINPRFHTSVNILTGNFCVCGTLNAIFWTIHIFTSPSKDWRIFVHNHNCIFYLSCSTTLSALLIHSLLMISVNRYLIIRYPNKQVFKRNSCSLLFCIGQWITSCLLCIPHLVSSIRVTVFHHLK